MPVALCPCPGVQLTWHEMGASQPEAWVLFLPPDGTSVEASALCKPGFHHPVLWGQWGGIWQDGVCHV